jgi:hypothetical protein
MKDAEFEKHKHGKARTADQHTTPTTRQGWWTMLTKLLLPSQHTL